MYFLSDYPDKDVLLQQRRNEQKDAVYKVNCHIHTPYSFSAFENIRQALDMAVKEDIRILGINDFFVADGYDEFYNTAILNQVFPEFNIEFIGLLADEQKKGIKVNDPSNPGRTYFSGKGLNYPFHVSSHNFQKLKQVRDESQNQVREMLSKTNDLLKACNAPFSLEFDHLKTDFAKELVRERHIAKAIRVKLNECFPSESERLVFLNRLYEGKEPGADLNNNTLLEEELRGNLLKAGGAAYVRENEKAFLPVQEIIEIIVDAGGIPCYPVLLDNKKGELTEFEEDYSRLADRLTGLGVGCLELIPARNRFENLLKFVTVMENRGFLILFGTEHNTPQMMPMTVKASDKQLDSFLIRVAYEGACVVAAHQYLNAKGEEGFTDKSGLPKLSRKNEFIRIGKAVVEKFLSVT